MNITCESTNVARALQVELRLQTKSVETVEEELPGEDIIVGHDDLEEHEALEDHRPVTYHGVKLKLQAPTQTLEGTVQ